MGKNRLKKKNNKNEIMQLDRNTVITQMMIIAIILITIYNGSMVVLIL